MSREWAGAVVGSIIGSTTTAYVLGDEKTRTTIHFLIPFLILGAIGTIKLLSENKLADNTFFVEKSVELRPTNYVLR